MFLFISPLPKHLFPCIVVGDGLGPDMLICSGAIVWWLSVRSHKTGVVSSIPLCVTW